MQSATDNVPYEFTKIHIWNDGPLFATIRVQDDDWWGLALAEDDKWVLWKKSDPACNLDLIREVQLNAVSYEATLLPDGLLDLIPIEKITEDHLLGEGSDYRLSIQGMWEH